MSQARSPAIQTAREGRWVFRPWSRALAWPGTHPALTLALIMVASLGLGVAKLWIDPPNEAWNLQNRWWQVALNVAHGDGYVACKTEYFPFCGPDNRATAMREPLPVLLFATVALLTNDSLVAAASLGIAFNLATIAIVYLLGRELAGAGAGLLAALMWALYIPPVRELYPQVTGDLLATMLLSAALLTFLRARRSGHALLWLAAGGLLGLAILSRSAVLVIALVLTVSLAVGPWKAAGEATGPRASRLRPLALFALAWFVVMSPWLVRNYVVFERPVAGSTLSGYYLYRQSHALQDGEELRFVTGDEFEPVLRDMLARRADLTGRENEAQMDALYRREAAEAIRAEPLRYLLASGQRAFMLWFNWDVNAAYGQRDTPLDYVVMVQQALLLAAGIAGARLCWRAAWPLAASVAAFSVLYMLVQAHLLYVIPVMPLVVALGAVAAERVARWAFALRPRNAPEPLPDPPSPRAA